MLEQVQDMLANQVIEPSTSPYCSPVVLVKKKDGSWWFCVDYRKLNSITQDVTHTLTRIQDSLKELGNARTFSTLDLRQGYWQVPMHPDAKKYMAFAIPNGGTYQFRVMPSGIRNAPHTFQYLIGQIVVQDYINKFCIAYLEDIIIYSQNWEEHLKHLHLELERLQMHGLACSIDKCSFGQMELRYLGYSVSTNFNEPQECHIQAILQESSPESRRELQQFLGICTWLRDYVPDFSIVSAPLTNLLEKNTGRWT